MIPKKYSLLPIFLLSILVLATKAADHRTETPEFLLKVAEWDQDRDGTNDSYVEVIKQGDQILSSYSRLPSGTEVGIWLDERHSYSMTDTNQDGRFDRFTFFTDLIPQRILVRTDDDKLEPINPEELQRIQEFSSVVAEEFPKMTEAAGSTNENKETVFWQAFTNIVDKAMEVGEETQQTGEAPNMNLDAQAIRNLQRDIRLSVDRLTHLGQIQDLLLELVVEVDLAGLEAQGDDLLLQQGLLQMHQYLTHEVTRAQLQVNALESASRGGPMPWSDFMKGKGPEYDRYLKVLEELGPSEFDEIPATPLEDQSEQ